MNLIKKIAKGYGELFGSILKILFLLVLCVGFGAAVVFPLWKFASSAPEIYTYAVIFAAAILAAVFAAKKIKSNGAKHTLIALSKFAVVAGGAASIFILVIFGLKILSIPVLVLMIFLYGMLSFASKKESKNSLSN